MRGRQLAFWRDHADRDATAVQWLDNLLMDELVSHALLFAQTPLERVLAKELAWLTDPDKPACSACPERAAHTEPKVG